MLKIKKSILMVCLISVFLLASHACAADTGLNDINSVDESLIPSDFDDSLILSEDYIDEYDFKGSDELYCNDLDNNDDNEEALEIVEEKDTTGIVMAGDNYSCGPASLATLLNRYGLNLSLSEVSKITNTTEDGTSMQSLIDAAKHYNFSAFGVEMTGKDLRENTLVHLNLEGGEHWSVVTGVTDSHIFLADSTEGNINMSIEDFNTYFSGKAIIISKMNESDLKQSIVSGKLNILDKYQCSKVSAKGWKRVIVGYKTVWRYGIITKYSYVLKPKVVSGHVSFTQWEYVLVGHPVFGKYKVRVPIYKYKYVKVHI